MYGTPITCMGESATDVGRLPRNAPRPGSSATKTRIFSSRPTDKVMRISRHWFAAMRPIAGGVVGSTKTLSASINVRVADLTLDSEMALVEPPL